MSATLKQLAVFVAVVEQGGFGTAADELQMGQSAVSHTLAAMERSVGATLINRSPKIEPTGIGRMILPHARAALSAARAVDSLIGSYQGKKLRGPVRVAASPTASHRLVPRLLSLWHEVLPDVDIRILEGDDYELDEWLETGAVDCAVLVDPVGAASGSVELIRDYFQAVLRTDHPFSSLRSIELAELVEDPLLVSSSGCEPQIKKIHKMSGVRFHPSQRVREVSTLLSMVESNLGVAIMPSLAASMLPESLMMVDLEPKLERRLVFAGPKNRPWHPYVTRMRDIAEENTPPNIVPPQTRRLLSAS